MSPADDELDRRLRGALSSPRPSDGAGVDELLSRVHRGASVRRVRRGVAGTAAAALALAGGGVAIGASGYLDDSHVPVASDPTTGQPTLGTFASTPWTTTLPPSRSKTYAGPEPPTVPTTGQPTLGTFASTPWTTTLPPSRSKTYAGPEPPTVEVATVTPGGPIAAADVHPLSLTATGTDHQWVLARTPGEHCGRPACATLFATADHGTNWTDVGQLPAPPASSDNPGPTSVSQLRFTKRADGSETYDGWAYGGGLLTTHDSGRTWSSGTGPPGRVTQLESWGDIVYAGVSNPGLGDDTATLYRSPSTADAWQAVPVGRGLTSVQSLAAANGVLGLVDAGGLHAALYLSTDGLDWKRQAACPTGFDPRTVSTASDSAAGVSSLWVTCTDPTSAVILYTDTTDPGSWHPVKSTSLGAAVVVAARTPTAALVAGAGVGGIVEVSATSPPRRVFTGDVGAPVLFGFTNPRYGYLVESDATVLATTDGGATWLPYAVTDTAP